MATPEDKVATASTTASALSDEELERIIRESKHRSEATPDPEPPQKAGAAGEIPIERTHPDSILRHDISDEELDMIGKANKDGVSEAIWGCFGVFTGTLIPSIRSICNAYRSTNPIPLDWINLLQVILCVSGIAVGVALWFFFRGTKDDIRQKLEEIRSRTRDKANGNR